MNFTTILFAFVFTVSQLALLFAQITSKYFIAICLGVATFVFFNIWLIRVTKHMVKKKLSGFEKYQMWSAANVIVLNLLLFESILLSLFLKHVNPHTIRSAGILTPLSLMLIVVLNKKLRRNKNK